MGIAIIASLTLVLITIVIHAEGLGLVSRAMGVSQLRRKMAQIVFCVFLIHLVEVLLYALAYWFFDNVIDLGSFGGDRDHLTFEYLYFSIETFTTLGLGDLYPIGPLRLLAGIESVNGLLLLGWSTSFIFYVMQEHWVAERRAAN